MTKVIQRMVYGWTAAALAAVCFSTLGRAQSPAPASPAAPAVTSPAKAQSTPGPAEALYLKLHDVGLDKSKAYKIREAVLDRAGVHISLNDGKIAFTQDVAGRVTGAFFEGDGEILLMPPNEMERASMALFTGSPILEEPFTTAYFRFNDDTYAELKPFLQTAEDPGGFVDEWNETARNLASTDALRLLLSFSKLLPVSGESQKSTPPPDFEGDRLLHARMQGRNLGTFDVYFDTRSAEQVWAGGPRIFQGREYYNVWTSFALPAMKKAAGAGGQEEELNPNTVRVTGYRIRAEVRPPTELSAEAHVQAVVLQGGERTLLFELSRYLEIESVVEDGHPLEFIHNPAIEGTQLSRRGNDLVAVVFPQPLQTGEKLDLRFAYHGDVLSDAGGGLMYVGARGTWYPNRGMEMANFDMVFHYPVNWTLVATGKRIEAPAGGAEPAGEQVGRWVSERPIPLAGFNLGKYSHAEAKAGDVKVDTYAASAVERNFPEASLRPALPALLPPIVPIPPIEAPRFPPPAPPRPSPARTAPSVSEMASRAITSFARWYGPFPYSHLSLTQMPGHLSQGWPELIFLSSYVFLTPEEQAGLQMNSLERILSRGVVAHETAHQWWGDLVSWDSYRDQWVMEGLAEYSVLMLLDEQEPAQVRAILEKYRSDLLEKDKNGKRVMNAGPVTLGNRLSSSEFPTGYETVAYERGTWLFYMLHTMLQDGERKQGSGRTEDPFLRGLRQLRERYQGKAITTREMLAAFEGELPPSLRYDGEKSLDWFYNDWINGTAIPQLTLENVRYSERGGATAITGTILQNDAPDDFVTSVPVYAIVGGQKVFLGRVFADGKSSDFHLRAPAHTRKVVLDPYQTLLTRNR